KIELIRLFSQKEPFQTTKKSKTKIIVSVLPEQN
ncbi:hypothetical protein SS7213T_04691, partial [Staphylococcus simiae CCM 7213 = CCUG 51256]